MGVLRLIKGVTRLDRLWNEDIRKELDIDSILDLVERRQLRWYGNVKRMADHRYPKRFLEMIPEGRRPVGRPRMWWLDNIKNSVERRGSSVQQVQEEIYADRAQWRRFLKQVDWQAFMLTRHLVSKWERCVYLLKKVLAPSLNFWSPEDSTMKLGRLFHNLVVAGIKSKIEM